MVYLARFAWPRRGSFVPDILCVFCRAVIPATGAFDLVLCPVCKRMTPVRGAALAPSPASGAPAAPYTVPAGHTIETAAFLPPPPPHFVRRAARVATLGGAFLVAFLLAANMVTLFVGIPTGIDYALNAPDPFLSLFVVFPLRYDIVVLTDGSAAFFYALLVATIALSVGGLVRRHGKDAWGKVTTALRGEGTPALSDPNALFALTRLFSASLFVTLAINHLAAAAGSPPHAPQDLVEAPLGGLLIALAQASVWEELALRVLLLGVPLLTIHYLGRGRLERPARSYFLGGGFVLDGPAVAFVLFQAAVFGIAHFAGWDLVKVPSAAAFGVAAGVLFLRYGLAAAIAAHFLLDYLDLTRAMSAGTSFPTLVNLAKYTLFVVGVVSAIRYVFVIMEIARARRVPEYMGGPPGPVGPAPSRSNEGAGPPKGEG